MTADPEISCGSIPKVLWQIYWLTSFCFTRVPIRKRRDVHRTTVFGRLTCSLAAQVERNHPRAARLYAVFIPWPAIQHRLNAAVIILPLMANPYDMDNCTAYAGTLRLSLLRLDQAGEVLTRSEKEPLTQMALRSGPRPPRYPRIRPHGVMEYWSDGVLRRVGVAPGLREVAVAKGGGR